MLQIILHSNKFIANHKSTITCQLTGDRMTAAVSCVHCVANGRVMPILPIEKISISAENWSLSNSKIPYSLYAAIFWQE